MTSVDNSIAVFEWLGSIRNKKSRQQYSAKWRLWILYCKSQGLPSNGDAQLEDMKNRRLSTDNTEKYLYDNELPKFYIWLTTKYVGKKTGEHLSPNTALAHTTAVRSFFAFHRYTLEIRKDAIPSTNKIVRKYKDHAFDIYQLRSMFKQGDLKEQTILACGKDLWLRVGDFANISRNSIELLLKREQELADNEKRDMDIVEFELLTEKEKEPASCHFSKETIELLSEYLRTYPKSPHSEKLFPLTEDAINDLLKRLARKAKITKTGRIRWHCLRKFGITIMHGKIQEPVMKFMTGKHIDESLRTYIQANNETKKAFKLIEPLISLTKSNGNGNSRLAKQLEDLQKTTFKQMLFMKLMEKLVSKEQMAKALEELASELDIKLKPAQIAKRSGKLEYDFEDAITQLSEALEKKDLERILKENGNNDH
jgi:hypothetical protein